MIMKDIYIRSIAGHTGVRDWQVENCVKLLDEGATIPFISRYRKERTGGLDEVAVAEIRHWHDVFVEMDKRKSTIIDTVESSGALTAELRQRIESCVDARELEDIYLPFKPKRRTRATIAKEAGLEGIESVLEGTTAIALSSDDQIAPAKVAAKYADQFKNYFNIKLGFMDGEIMESEKVVALGKLPSKDQLVAQLLSVLTGNIRGLAVALNAIAEKEPA